MPRPNVDSNVLRSCRRRVNRSEVQRLGPRVPWDWQKEPTMASYSPMGVRLLILIFLATLPVTPAGAGETAPEPGRCPYAIKPLPRSVTRAVDRIVADMYPELRDKVLATKREDLVQFRQDWGKGIRTQLCLVAGGNDQLLRSACGGELCHPETASMVIMEAVWDRLESVQQVLRPAQRLSAKR